MNIQKYIPKVKGHILVTGGGGIGAEVIRAVLANGNETTKVSFTYDKNKKRAEELEAELLAEGYHVKAFHFSTKDVHIEADIERLLDTVVEWAGEEIAGFVNTIAVSPNKSLEEQTIQAVGDSIDDLGWVEVLRTNFVLNFFLVRTVAKRMRSKGIIGSIVVISSDNSTESWQSDSAHYDGSKAGVNLTSAKHLAKYFARVGIRINVILPGWTNTSLNDTLSPEQREEALSRIWLGRFGEPHEVAVVAMFLLSSVATFIVGAQITVNGGYN